MLLGLLVTTPGYGQWSIRFGGSNDESIGGLGLDAGRHLYVVGTFTEHTNLGGDDLTATGVSPLYLARFGPGGNHQWSRAVSGEFFGTRLAMAEDRRLSVGGNFEGEIDFGDGQHTGDRFEVFFTWFEANFNGALLGSRSGTGSGQKRVNGLTFDAAGNLTAVGAFNGEVSLGGELLTGVNGGTDLYLVKYDADGEHLWSVKYGGEAEDHPLDAALDAQDRFYVAGFFSLGSDPTETNLGGATLDGAGGADVFLASYDADGTHRWSRAFGTSADERATSVVVDQVGSVYIAGFFEETISLGGDTHVSHGGVDVFLAKYDADGTFQWSLAGGSPANDFTGALALGEAGNLYLAGSFSDAIEIGGEALTGAGGRDVFLASWRPDGSLRWARRYGGSGDDSASRLRFDADGNLYLAGTFEDTIDLGHGSLTSAGGRDGFVLQLDAASIQTGTVVSPDLPDALFALSPSYPNPFTDVTTVTLVVSRAQRVRVAVYDLLGRQVALLHDGPLEPGLPHALSFDARALPEGVYVLRAEGDTFSATRSMVRLR